MSNVKMAQLVLQVRLIPLVIAIFTGLGTTAHADLIGTYLFNNSLDAQEPNAPKLTAVENNGTTEITPANQVYESAGFIINGVNHTRTVYAFGTTTVQNGLRLDTSGTLTGADDYSLDLVFRFDQQSNNFDRILDTLGGGSDDGLYANAEVLFVVSEGTQFSSLNSVDAANKFATFHRLVITNDPSVSENVRIFVDGEPVPFPAGLNPTDALDATSDFLFFLDNTSEEAPGQIAYLGTYNNALSAAEAQALSDSGMLPDQMAAVPEPSSLPLAVGLGFGLFYWRRRKSNLAKRSPAHPT